MGKLQDMLQGTARSSAADKEEEETQKDPRCTFKAGLH
jgi:hypothetical protein